MTDHPSRDILVYAEQRNGRPADVSLELLGKARELASHFGTGVSAAVIGSDCRQTAETLASHGADRVFVIEDPRLDLYQADAYTTILTRLVAKTRPEAVLVGGTSTGADLAPAVAARLGTGLTAHCTDFRLETIDGREQLVMVVPGWHGSLMLKIVCPEKRPVMATVRPGVMEKAGPAGNRGEVIAFPVELTESDFRAKTLEKISEGETSALDDARIVVSGGFGFYEAGGTALLESLAAAIGGVTAGSRPACDAGWVPESRMIGQSGKTLSPELFISIGASGAPHYTTGFLRAKVIAAIDRNPKAPIFETADVGWAGDLRELIPALLEALK